MALHVPFHILLFSVFIPIIQLQTSNEEYKPEIILEFESNGEILGKNVQYKIELFLPKSPSQESCHYEQNLPISKTINTETYEDASLKNITVIFPFEKPLRTSLLCFKITPFKFNESCNDCQNHVQYQTHNLIGPGTTASDLYMYHFCFGWRMLYHFQRTPIAESLWEFGIQRFVPDMYEQCFDNFAVCWLHSDIHADECKFEAPFVRTKCESKPYYEKPWISDVKPGYNCMIIYGLHVTCLKPEGKQWCRGISTNISLILNNASVEEVHLSESKPDKNEPRYWITVGCGILVIVIAVGLVGAALGYYHFVVKLRRSQKQSPSTSGSGIEDDSDHSDPNSVEIIPNPKIQNTKKKEVTILYTQEVPEILEAILALGNFLRTCCNLIVRIDIEDDSNLTRNPNTWYSRGDFYIIVETEGAVYRERACIERKDIYHVDEDFTDTYFMHNLIGIIQNPDSMGDYSKYLLVHFSFTPSQHRFRTVALNKRYVISQHIAQLCHFISHGKDMVPSTENLSRFDKKWEGHEHLKALNHAITKASKFVSQNPDYVKNVFIERI